MHHPESTGLSRIRGYADAALAQVEIDFRNRHRTMRSISAGEGGSARQGLTAGAERVSAWGEGPSKGRYLASHG